MIARWHGPVAFLLYLGFTVALTYPLPFHLSTAVPSDPGDPLLNTWILWWNAQAVPLTATWWNAPIFQPVDEAFAFSEHLLGVSVISTPIQWLGGTPLLAYNIAFLLSFPLCAVAAYLLAGDLTGRRDAAFLAGLVFGFAPYRIAHLPHLQVLSAYWMPLALLGLHRYLRDRRARWLVLFGLAWVLQSLANGYYLMFFSVLVCLWLLWFAIRPSRRRISVTIVAAWAGSALTLLPLLWRYRMIHERFGFTRELGEIGGFAADVAALFDATQPLAVWGSLQLYHRAEGELFPGLTVLLLVVASLVTADRAGATVGGCLSWVRTVVVLLAGVAALVAVSVLLVGPWEIRVLGMKIISVSDPIKPLTQALLLGLVLIFISRRVVTAYRTQSVLGFYAVAAFVTWLFSLGPTPTLMGSAVMCRGPYALLMLLPGFESLRVPARFAMITMLCLSAVAALVFVRLASRFGRWRPAVAVIVCVGVLADGWVSQMPLVDPPSTWRVEECTSPAGTLAELPLGDPGRDLAAMYRGMHHGRPLVNGYSGYFPPHYAALRHGLALYEDDLLAKLATLGVRYVAVDEAADADGALGRLVARHEDAELICRAGAQALYRLLPRSRADSPGLGEALRLARVSASVNGDQALSMTDGDRVTRWHSGPQTAGTRVDIDLGAVRQVGAVVMELGPFAEDFPRGLAVQTSEDGRQWTEIWRGAVAGQVLEAALADPQRLPVTFDTSAAPARFIRMQLASDDPVYYWSIAEIRVVAPAGSR